MAIHTMDDCGHGIILALRCRDKSQFVDPDKGSAESSIKQNFCICTSCKMKYNICKGQSQMAEYTAAELAQAALYWDI